MEDRPEFAEKALFPAAEEVHLIDFYHISDSVSISSDDYVCIMTRGHAHDTIIQAEFLARSAAAPLNIEPWNWQRKPFIIILPIFTTSH